jgi:hypothetical protein
MPKSEELTAGWRKWHDQELYNCTLHQTLYIGMINQGQLYWFDG